jgi:hypothetical protein
MASASTSPPMQSPFISPHGNKDRYLWRVPQSFDPNLSDEFKTPSLVRIARDEIFQTRNHLSSVTPPPSKALLSVLPAINFWAEGRHELLTRKT